MVLLGPEGVPVPGAIAPRPAPQGAHRRGAMNTPAACRTYNILLGEGRNVVAAIIL